mmetsp:Transcript_6904/g.15622  ORF Transcript_6904/g.15622 Transcript_6904/m.15622 type:complete len:255 (-) Transcript_6904:392-1156(-)
MTCRICSMSLTDCSCMLFSLLVITSVISMRMSSIFLFCSACICLSVSVAVSFVSSFPFSSFTSCWIFCNSSSCLLPSSAPESVNIWMHSMCRCRICTMWLSFFSMKVAFSTFFTCIIFCANVSVMKVSVHHSDSGPMFAMRRARAVPPRQSRRSIVSAEFLKPAPVWAPAFRLLTTAPRCVSTRLMPMACRLRSSSSPSLLAATFFRLSEPARSTSTSFPTLTRESSFSLRHSTVTQNRQWDREEWQLREVSRK